MEEMPVPVPQGRWNEYAAAISEGFCPQCRRPFTSAIEGLPIILARCDRDGCRCCWELDMKAIVPAIRWRGPGKAPDSWWDICVFPDGPDFGPGRRSRQMSRLSRPRPPLPA